MQSETLTREELYELVWNSPLLTLAKKYHISDVGLRKICVKHDIPLPKAGHWQKIKFGKKSRQPPLSNSNAEGRLITLHIRAAGDIELSGELSPRKLLRLSIKREVGDNLRVPDKLSKPDALILAAKENLSKGDEDRYTYIGMLSTGKDGLNIQVTKKSISRALLFYDTLMKLLRSRKFDIQLRERKTYVIGEDYKDEIILREKSKKELRKDGLFNRTVYMPIGTLSLRVGYREWKDGKVPLEEQLLRIITSIELAARDWHEAMKKRRAEELDYEEKQRIKKEFEALREVELKAFRNTLEKSVRWHKTNTLRDYINEVESRITRGNDPDAAIGEWLTWARSKADWYDPFLEKEDPLFLNVDRNTLTVTIDNNSSR